MTRVVKHARRLVLGSTTLGLAAMVYHDYSKHQEKLHPPKLLPTPVAFLPSRTENVAELMHSAAADAEYDVAVIGGGVIGCGVALDAASRGLKVCLFESEDFGAGATSHSAKLLQVSILCHTARQQNKGMRWWARAR